MVIGIIVKRICHIFKPYFIIKYLGFSLKDIKTLMQQNEEELLPHLKKQLNLMQNEKENF